MAVDSIYPATGPYAAPATKAVSVRDRNSLAQQIPALAVPGTRTTLGATAVAPLLYNPAGLLSSLGTAEKAGAMPSGTAASAGTAGLQGNLETVLGLNSDSGFLANSTLAGSLGNLSENSGAALVSVLAAGSDNGSALASAPAADGGNETALEQLLARAIETFASGQDRTRSAATVLNAAGVLRTASSEQLQQALESLRTANLGLAATAIDAGSGNTQGLQVTALPAGSGTNGDNQVFSRNMNARLEESVAGVDAARPRRRATASAGADDLLLSGVSILTGASDASSIDSETTLLADPLTQEPAIPADALARLVTNLPRRAEETAAPKPATAEFASDAGAAAVTTPPASATGNRPVATTTPAPDRTLGSVAQPGGTAAAPAASATPAVTREPRYAEIAASMTMGAAVYRFRASVSTVTPPGAVDPLRTVLQVRPAPAVSNIR